MAQKRLTRALIALAFVLPLASCASAPMRVDGSESPRHTIQPASSFHVLGRDKKGISDSSKEAGCILSTGAVHLWCNGVSRYY
jgi:starvation-inducible outer membrane lipoprotein